MWQKLRHNFSTAGQRIFASVKRRAVLLNSLLILLMVGYVGLGLRRIVPVPYAISLPGIAPITLYSITVLVALAVAIVLFRNLIKSEPALQKVDVWELVGWVLLPGIIGARLFFVATQWELYSQNTTYILALWEGGLNIFGGLILGAVGLALFCRKYKLDVWRLAAVIAVILPLAHAVGRLASFFGREYYGAPTSLPWGAYIESGFRFLGLEQVEYYQPNFLYEMVGNLVIFLILWQLWRRKGRQVTAEYTRWQYSNFVKIYLGGYGVLRYLLDFLLITPKTSWGLSATQIFILASFIIVVIGGWSWHLWHLFRHKRWWRP